MNIEGKVDFRLRQKARARVGRPQTSSSAPPSSPAILLLAVPRRLDDLLHIDYNFFDSMVNRIYPSELQLNKANA